jgi:hypothetical protein
VLCWSTKVLQSWVETALAAPKNIYDTRTSGRSYNSTVIESGLYPLQAQCSAASTHLVALASCSGAAVHLYQELHHGGHNQCHPSFLAWLLLPPLPLLLVVVVVALRPTP